MYGLSCIISGTSALNNQLLNTVFNVCLKGVSAFPNGIAYKFTLNLIVGIGFNGTKECVYLLGGIHWTVEGHTNLDFLLADGRDGLTILVEDFNAYNMGIQSGNIAARAKHIHSGIAVSIEVISDYLTCVFLITCREGVVDYCCFILEC